MESTPNTEEYSFLLQRGKQIMLAERPTSVRIGLRQFAQYMNPRSKDLSLESPQLNAAPLFGSENYIKIGYPDIHPSVSMWGHDTYITGWVKIDEESAIYPGCNFNGDAMMPLTIGKRCSLQHVELHYSGFRMLSTVIGDDTFMSHLAFAHSVKIGRGCYILGHVAMYDGAEIGENVFIEGNATILGSARLESGWAYSGVVDKDTKPICRTSEVVFGIDPKTGRSLYIGGSDGVARTVNNSHLSRNANQMRLVAFKNGWPEKKQPAYAVTIPHVYQTALHYLSLAAQILDQMQKEHGTESQITVQAQLIQDCLNLCASIRTIYHGQDAEKEVIETWQRRTAIIADIVHRMEHAPKSYIIECPPLGKGVLQEKNDLQVMARKLREFEMVMQQQEVAYLDSISRRNAEQPLTK